MGEHLTVSEAAAAPGTSPQTVRTLLRNGELRGQKRGVGGRYVWDVSREGVEEFLADYGRLDGRRRPTNNTRPRAPEVAAPVAEPAEQAEAASYVGLEPLLSVTEPEPSRRRPFVLRPRGRATVVVVVLGV